MVAVIREGLAIKKGMQQNVVADRSNLNNCFMIKPHREILLVALEGLEICSVYDARVNLQERN